MSCFVTELPFELWGTKVLEMEHSSGLPNVTKKCFELSEYKRLFFYVRY